MSLRINLTYSAHNQTFALRLLSRCVLAGTGKYAQRVQALPRPVLYVVYIKQYVV